jgi:biopolymer transport protein ExbD
VKDRALRIAPVEEEEPAMLMTSMIDVIFILLAFFVCVSEVRNGKLDVDLQRVEDAATTASEQSEIEPIVVEVTSDDRISIGGESAKTEADVARLIAKAVEKVGKDAPVHLKGDKAAKNGTMMRVVGHLSKAGLKKIEFAVETGG